jgi:hypothetical protein
MHMALTLIHVSPSGDDQNSGAEDAPKRTVQAAVDALPAGGIVNLGPGNYLLQRTVELGGRRVSLEGQGEPSAEEEEETD